MPRRVADQPSRGPHRTRRPRSGRGRMEIRRSRPREACARRDSTSCGGRRQLRTPRRETRPGPRPRQGGVTEFARPRASDQSVRHRPYALPTQVRATTRAFASLQSRITVSGDTSRLRRFLHAQAAEEAHLHDLAFRASTAAKRCKASSNAIRSWPGSSNHRNASSRETFCARRPFLYASGARRVDQDAPHDARRHREEVGAVLPLHLVISISRSRPRSPAPWPEGSGRQAAAGICAGDALQFVVHDRHELVKGGGVAFLPGEQQLGGSSAGRRCRQFT